MPARRHLAYLACLVATSAGAADGWSLEVAGGDAFSFNNRLKIEQDGGYSQSVNADYETRAFRSPLYYMLRAGRWQGDDGWELSLLHHKLYLTNPPPGVSGLSISHGFNIITVNRAFNRGDWTYRLGAGPVVTHAEATILSTTYDGPYRLAGAAALASVGRRLYIGENTFLNIEGALTIGAAKPKMPGPPDAELSVRNVAVHALFGIGRHF